MHIGVARTGHLLALKFLSRAATRPLDDVDITRLLEVADDEERSLALELLALMAERGTDRGRDLVAAWEDLLAGRTRPS